MISELNSRSREIFRLIVDAYVATGEPIGSRSIAQKLGIKLSSATVRNVMSDLEEAGLLYAPHTSAGRLPTEAGLRMFVNGLLEIGNLSHQEREDIKGQFAGSSTSLEGILEQATEALSGLTGCASLVLAPKTESPLRHIEFVYLSPGRALVVLVTENGIVENRIVQTPEQLSPSSLIQASNFLSARLVGRTLEEASEEITGELEQNQDELDALTKRVVESGLATWGDNSNDNIMHGSLIVRGQANLLEDIGALNDLEQIRNLFNTLETKQEMLKLLSLAETAEGVQIFIGAENKLFSMASVSVVVNSFQNSSEQVLGAIGVIGPTRMNYARIIPMVDYTAKLIGRILG
ncbi:MAG: heat-inducible transcriptional repressor HrcA [Magnetovibrio sp.]|nr:heat-inducible transcriptional repressor HrcA [Magnetovibrio sp.]|tara:strand:+ start:1188 stop:2234 length:1047 start_codon:yes stop_codon:yes gene_type:complete